MPRSASAASRRRLTASTWRTLIVTATVIFCLAPPAAAQEQARTEQPRTLFTGRVLEGSFGNPLPTAIVEIAGTRHLAITGEDGSFAFRLTPGQHTFVVKVLGYENLYQTLVLPEGSPIHEFVLTPRPVVLEAIRVVDYRLTRRRKAVATSVRVLDRAELLHSFGTAVDVVLRHTGMIETPCPSTTDLARCAWVRGEVVPVTVAIDDRPAFAGLDELESYNAHELFVIEVYSGGSHVRAYTTHFMQRPEALVMPYF